jgi:hypothetical protein
MPAAYPRATGAAQFEQNRAPAEISVPQALQKRLLVDMVDGRGVTPPADAIAAAACR